MNGVMQKITGFLLRLEVRRRIRPADRRSDRYIRRKNKAVRMDEKQAAAWFAERYHEKDFLSRRMTAYRMAVRSLMDNRWTPVTEALPKKYQAVLASFDDGSVDLLQWQVWSNGPNELKYETWDENIEHGLREYTKTVEAWRSVPDAWRKT